MPNNNNPARNLDNDARSKGGRNSSSNFKNNPQRASEAGRKGGQRSHRGGGSDRNSDSDNS